MKNTIKKRWLRVASHMVAYDPVLDEKYCTEEHAFEVVSNDEGVLHMIDGLLNARSTITELDENALSAQFIHSFDMKYLNEFRKSAFN